MWIRTRGRREEAIQFRHSGKPVSGTGKWEVIRPWHATYWKTFPEGYHVQLRTSGSTSPADWTEEEMKWPETLRWYRSPREFR